MGAVPPTAPQNGPSRGRVLVVDDDDVIRQLITVNLELEGFEVATAVDGQDCLDKVKEVDPAVVTLDIMMPRMDGFQARQALLESEATAGIPVIFLSARAQQADIERGQEAGVAEYVVKPFDPMELVKIIEQILEGVYQPEPKLDL